AKQPAKRYVTASELAADLRRFRDGKPIVARPVGSLERAAKWVKRNPVVTGAALAVTLALAVGTGASYAKYRDARRQERIAKEQERIAILKAAEAENARAGEAERVQERDAALDDAKYQLGIGNMLLAIAAYESRDVRLARERLDKVPAEYRKFEWHYLERLVQ